MTSPGLQIFKNLSELVRERERERERKKEQRTKELHTHMTHVVRPKIQKIKNSPKICNKFEICGIAASS
jgi:hypothetical protein